jgi:hypothetical protein
MPQFDFFSFSSQAFWISISTIFFYLFFLRFFLRNLSECFKMRQKLFQLQSKKNFNKIFDKKMIYKKLMYSLLRNNHYENSSLTK